MNDTQLTQMALSAILRCKEQINIFELSSVLCGKDTRIIKQKGFDHIKTFGAGKAYSSTQWHYMLIQMIQMDYFEIGWKVRDILYQQQIGVGFWINWMSMNNKYFMILFTMMIS